MKIRVPTRVFPFYVVWSFEFRLELPIGFNARVGTDRSFEDSSFSKLGFSIFIIILKIRVPTRVSPFYVVWSFEFRLELPIRIQRSCWNRSFFWKFEFFKTRVFHFYYYFEDPSSDSGFPFLTFEVSSSDSNFLSDSTLVLEPIVAFEDSSFSKLGFSIFIIILKIRVPTRVFPFYVVWSFEFRLELPIGFNARVGTDRFFEDSSFSKLGFSIVPTRVVSSFSKPTLVLDDRSFEDSSFSKLGFSIFIIILKIRVPTRVFPFYVVWSFEFRLELPIGFNARVGTDRSFENSSFSKLGFSIFIIILKIRVPTRVFPFYVVWSFEFRLELPIGFNARVGTDRSFEDSSFQNSGFPFLLLFWRSGFRLGFSLFMSFEVSSSDSNFLSDSTLVLEPIVPLKIRVFQNSGFLFLLLFWRSGFQLGFSLFMSFKFSSSDSNFLSDSTLVLELIVPLKIRVFQNSGFPFLLLFWRSGFRLGFSLFMSFEVSSSDSNFLSDSTLVLEPIVPLKIRVFQNSGFPFLLLFWRSGFRLGFSLFMSFEVSSSDSNFLSDSTLVLEPIVPLKIRVFQNSGFPFLFLFWRSGFRLGFSLFMSFEVSSSDSNFLSDSTLVLEPIVPFEDSSFSKLGFSIFIIIWKIRVSGFQKFRLGIQCSCWNRSLLWRFEFFKTRVFHFYYYFEDPGSDSGFPFLCRLKFRVPTRTSYRIQRSCWNRSFLWRFEFFKTRVFHFYYYFEDPGSDSGFPFLCPSFDSNFLSNSTLVLEPIVPLIRVFQNSGFPFLTRSGFRLGFSLFMSFEVSNRLELPIGFNDRVGTDRSFVDSSFSKLGFSIFIFILKFRVPTRVFPFYVVWSFEFRLELPIGFNARVGTDRSVVRVFQNSGFPFLLLFWRFGFQLRFSLFMSFEVSSFDSNFLSDSTLVLEPIVPLKIRVFQNSGFPFLLLFWRSGFRLGFSLFMSFKFSSSDSNFLTDSTLVLEPIVPLKIRVFQNSGFPFLLLFWRSGFRLGFSLFMSFEVSSSDSNFLSDSTLVLEPIVPLKIRVFQNSGFPFLLLFWRSGFRLGFSLFMSFEVSSSDSNFLSDSTLVLEPIVPLKIRVFQNSGFPFLFLFWRSEFRLGFSLFMTFEVSSSDSNFLSDSTLVLEPIIPL